MSLIRLVQEQARVLAEGRLGKFKPFKQIDFDQYAGAVDMSEGGTPLIAGTNVGRDGGLDVIVAGNDFDKADRVDVHLYGFRSDDWNWTIDIQGTDRAIKFGEKVINKISRVVAGEVDVDDLQKKLDPILTGMGMEEILN